MCIITNKHFFDRNEISPTSCMLIYWEGNFHLWGLKILKVSRKYVLCLFCIGFVCVLYVRTEKIMLRDIITISKFSGDEEVLKYSELNTRGLFQSYLFIFFRENL